MKFFKNIAATLAFIALTTQLSIANPKEDPNADLRQAVTKLLMKPGLHITMDEEVRISFFVTEDDHLVILKTDARTKSLDEFIKNRMNYQKIEIKDLEVNRIFTIKVDFSMDQDR